MTEKENERSPGQGESTHLSVACNDYSTTAPGCQGGVERLEDDRFPWLPRKLQTIRLDRLYRRAKLWRYAERAKYCSSWLEYLVDTGGEKQLHRFNACGLRLCPLCGARRAKRAAHLLTQVLDMVQAEHPGTRYIFLTLTVRSVPGDKLGETITKLTEAWAKLRRNRRFERAVQGWFRAIEITAKSSGIWVDTTTGEVRERQSYHPHIHAILAVPANYGDPAAGLYIKTEEWVARWRRSLKVDYDPVCDVRAAKSKKGEKANADAAIEAAKYATKDSEYISVANEDVAVQRVVDYTRALKGRRLTAYGGWLMDAAKVLKAEDLETGDLVHLDDDEIREDLAVMVEVYGWHFGVEDYILYSREPYQGEDTGTAFDRMWSPDYMRRNRRDG